MKVEDFDYELPEELIAQVPLEVRDSSRLLFYDDNVNEVVHGDFRCILDYLDSGDLLVVNDSKVLPCRIFGHKESGSKVELLLLNQVALNVWETLAKPGKKFKEGAVIYFHDKDNYGTCIEVLENGNRIVEFTTTCESVEALLDLNGEMPLPPYIKEKLADQKRYTTVYEKVGASSAAPTAGLHFTQELIMELEKKGVKFAQVLLNVGLGTFRPVQVENILEHTMHSEYYEITQETIDLIEETKRNGKKVICVGTTSMRVLETYYNDDKKRLKGDTSIFIYPGYEFKCADGLITNFHLPKSTLLMLVSAFLNSREKTLDLYEEAVRKKYRFFSFGDAMYLVRQKKKQKNEVENNVKI